MKKLSLLFALLPVLFWGCNSESAGTAEIRSEYPGSVNIALENPAAISRQDELIYLDIAEIKAAQPTFNPGAFVVFAGKTELPGQAIDADGDGNPETIAVLADFTANQRHQLTLFFAEKGAKMRDYPKRTQAEIAHKFGGHFENRKYIGGEFRNVQSLRVPPEHTDHSFFIRYEGPGWESDKVGYRFYLDWRNASDIFGKTTPEMVLQNVGLDGFDSYHEMSDWGMDILKVGESLGIGSIGMWHDGKAHRVAKTDSLRSDVLANGAIYSQIRTVYSGWEIAGKTYDLISDLSITAGSRLTRHDVHISGNPENLCTGIVKHPETRLLNKSVNAGGWGYLATFGKQSLNADKLGMAVLFRQADFLSFESDDHSEVVVLKPKSGKLQYYFLAAWELEPDGIRTESEFMKYLDELVEKLNQPVTVKF